MILCLDLGNSHIFGGVFDGEKILLRFRHKTDRSATSDQLGVFLKNVLRENNIDADKIEYIGISSVVPPLNYSLGSACIKYFNIEPFWLKSGVKTGLKITTKHPTQVGSDLIASAIAASNQFPNKNLIIADFGTATTFVPINKDKQFLGAVIQAGVRTSMQALQTQTEQLPTVQILKPKYVLGRDTISAIQAGLYYSQLGALKEILSKMCTELFPDEKAVVVGTGGFAYLFEQDTIFDIIIPDLVLQGIYTALQMNLQPHPI